MRSNAIAIIIAALSPDVREPTPLESYLCRALALTLCAFGILVVILTGSVPLTVCYCLYASKHSHPCGRKQRKNIQPHRSRAVVVADNHFRYTMPTLVISLIFHAAIGFLQYGQAMKGNGAPYYFACSINALLASVGLWCLLFATDRGHIARKVCSLKTQMLIS